MGKKHVLVTGGAGYVGSHAAWQLQTAGFTPVVLDNLSQGHEWAVKFGPLARGDIGDTGFVRTVCNEYKPLALLHFAAFIDVAESVAFPDKYRDNNLHKAKDLFRTVAGCGIKHAVFSSTAAVYGIPATDGPITEDTPLAPINPYGETKRDAEGALRALEGVSSLSLRYFNASGAAPEEIGIGEAHWPETHLIPRAILAALGNESKLTVFGTDYPTPDGTALRDYVHVTDLARAHVAALRYLLDGGKTTACNLGAGTGRSVSEVIAAVGAGTKHPVPVQHGPRRAGDPPRLVADISKARQLLDWRPEHSLEEIVASATAWHQGKQYRQAIIETRCTKKPARG